MERLFGSTQHVSIGSTRTMQFLDRIDRQKSGVGEAATMSLFASVDFLLVARFGLGVTRFISQVTGTNRATTRVAPTAGNVGGRRLCAPPI